MAQQLFEAHCGRGMFLGVTELVQEHLYLASLGAGGANQLKSGRLIKAANLGALQDPAVEGATIRRSILVNAAQRTFESRATLGDGSRAFPASRRDWQTEFLKLGSFFGRLQFDVREQNTVATQGALPANRAGIWTG